MNALLLPDDAIIILRRAVWQPDARRGLEIMSVSFWWTDELVQEIAQLCAGRNNWSYRSLMGYRTSVIQGKPDEQYQPVWDQVACECPNWPGLRPERNSESLAAELRLEQRRKCIELLRMERQIQKSGLLSLKNNPRKNPS